MCVIAYCSSTCGIARPMAIPPSRNMSLWIQFTSLSIQPLVWMYIAALAYVCIPCPHLVLITICSTVIKKKRLIHVQVKKYTVSNTRRLQKECDLAFCHNAAGEGDGAALPTGVLRAAVEVHVVGPVGEVNSTTAAKLWEHMNIQDEGAVRFLLRPV